MFWNARDLRDDVSNVLEYMNDNCVDVVLFMETRIHKEDLSCGKWKWLRGPEVLPVAGDAAPRLGMGAFVNKDKLIGASVVKR